MISDYGKEKKSEKANSAVHHKYDQRGKLGARGKNYNEPRRTHSVVEKNNNNNQDNVRQ